MLARTNCRSFILAGLLSISSLVAHGEDIFDDPFGKGKSYLGLQLGYGAGFGIGETSSGDGKDVEYVAVFPSLGIGISDILGENNWYEGNFDVVGEGEFFKSVEPHSGDSAGVALLLRYNFQHGKQFVPFLEAGVGVGYLDFDLRDQSDGLIFYPQAGLGFHYFLSDRLAMNLSWRLHHMSNAGTERPNNGINANLGLIGVIYRFN